jgi:HPt (histidine-containing phosphotransfer) domain-containing protein
MVAIAPNPSGATDYAVSERSSRDDGRDLDGRDLDALADEPAIDLVHLARQTMGDQALEIELLELFDGQSARIATQLAGARTGDAKFRGDLAHTLRGSALAIGAGRVACAAQAYEALSEKNAPSEGAASAALEALVEAVAEARAAIARLLA